MQKILLKKNLNDFFNKIIKYSNSELVAPVKHENTKFQVINSPDKIWLKGITDIPAKKWFMPENEVLFNYKDNKILDPKDKNKKRIIFGLRLCDLNSLQILDKVMLDPFYIEKRKKTVLIGLYCDNPDIYCFCGSMDLDNDCYDLFFYSNKDHYLIDVKTKKGEKLVKDLKTLKKEIKIPLPKNTKILEKNDIENHYKNKIWESDADNCLSCSACTIYCPTCNCYDIKDNLELNFKDGNRTRHEISCHLKSFTRVAGEKCYRDSRLSRFKHFVYHKIVYFRKRYKRPMCVGCARCLRVCPTKIDWVSTINLLQDEIHPKGK